MSKTKKKALLWLLIPFVSLVIIMIVAVVLLASQQATQGYQDADYQSQYGTMGNY